MRTNALEISRFDSVSDAIGHLARDIAAFFSSRAGSAQEPASRNEDIASLPDHLLRDIGLEPHQIGLPASQFRTQVDASGFRQSAFTVDANEMRHLIALHD